LKKKRAALLDNAGVVTYGGERKRGKLTLNGGKVRRDLEGGKYYNRRWGKEVYKKGEERSRACEKK